LGRPVGRYITLTATDSTFDMYSDSFRERAEVIAKAIGELCGGCERFLAVGLGNYALTSDAVGPLTAEKIFATRHIKSLAKEIDTDDLGEVTVIQPGVLGNTGIESSEQVKAIAERVTPQAIIAVDALACSELSNLGRTIQLCNTGISPGSGVENARKELSLSTLGVKCIAIGVPTVIDLCTAAQHIFGQTAPESSENIMVAPKTADKLSENCAKLIAMGINRAVHPALSQEDIQTLTC
ncbi:MAG: GPR endopeptidase, partial [Ruminococcus sp.]|nr:GPR endopeptidase [Ruminococcus sp.]